MPNLIKQVDAIFREWNKTDSPGCAIGIIHNGETIYKRGYGLANLELNVPITTSSVFYLASVSKQFTAMAIALLVEMGKICLTDNISKYIPELPDHTADITVENLIHHTSGIRDYLKLGSLTGKRLEDVWTVREFLEILTRQNALNFYPGDQFAYSNSGYVLLAIIVQRVTGKSLQTFSYENIFQPLGMDHTVFKEDHQLVILNRVNGYSRSSDNCYINEYHNLQVVGDGGLYSCVDDLILWDQNFYNNKLGKGKQSLIELVHTTTSLNNGTGSKYAFGLEYGTYRGVIYVSHSGNRNGASTQMKRFPEQNFSVICLSNLSGFETDNAISKIVDLYLAEFLQPTEKGTAIETPEVSQQEIRNLTGLYRNSKTGVTWRVEYKDDHLVVRASERDNIKLLPLGNKRFKGIGSPIDIEFKLLKNETDFQMVLDGNNPSPVVFEPVIAAQPTINSLDKYCGTYHSDDLDINYSCIVNDGRLVLRKNKSDDIELFPTIRDGFKGEDLDILFSRDENDLIVGFCLYNPRIWNINFTRIHEALN